MTSKKEFRQVHIAVLAVCILRKIKLWSGDTGLPEMTTMTNVRPILIVNCSVWLRISTKLNCGVGILGFLRRQQSRAFDRLWSNINDSVLLRISTSMHRSSPSTRSPQVIEKNRRLLDHAGLANFRVESPLARGSPDAATSTWWDLGR
uniref:Uncharacterized protein n=1 Tax=Vespula pensylvanica TaxID=30213 RepID=A0A834NQI1_VESPE|nr:hypothetical protein H0235_012259 [Vespula pensylvanica]